MKLHLPKGLFTAILAAFAVVTPSVYGADSISISFGGTTMDNVTDETSQLGGVTKGGWNIVSASNTSGTTVKNQSGTDAGTLVMSGIHGGWNSSVTDTDTVTAVVQRNYIDIKNHSGGNVHTISLSHNYWLADVTYYLSGDAGGTWAPMEVNGTQYIGGTDNTLDEGENPAWGTRGGVTEYGDGNSITVTGLAGGTIVGKNVFTSNSARATLGGMQVVDSSATRGYMTTLGAGETTATAATWTLNGQEVQYGNISTPKSLGVSAAAEGSTLKLASGDSINSIAVQANTLTVASDGTIGLNDIYLNSGTTFNLNAGITSGTNLSVRGAGTAHINASQTLGNLNLSSDLTTFDIGNNVTVAVNGAFSIGNSTALAMAEGSKLSLQEKSDGTMDGSFILNTTGTGTIELNNGKTVIIPGTDNGSVGDTGTASSIESTAFTGVISVKSGMLSLGNNGQWQGYWGLNLGSLKSIDLDGGSLRLFGAASTISTINVNAASAMTIQQASVTQGAANEATSGLPGYRINSLVLNENLSVRTNWRSVVEIGSVSGSGDISMDTAGSDRVLTLYVNKVDATAGMNMNFAANVNATLGGAANSTLSDVSHTLGGTITNAATLTVNGSITITDELSNFKVHTRGETSGELSENGTDGYYTIAGNTYYLVDNNGNGTCTITNLTATHNGADLALTQDPTTGDVTFVGGSTLDTIYHVNTADVTVGGANGTANTFRATAFAIAENRTVTVAGYAGLATTSEMLYNSTGAGNMVLAADASLARNQKAQLTGKLTISNGARLNLGNGDLNNDTSGAVGASISTFSTVELDNGTIYVNNPDDTINNLTVTANGGTIDVFDLGQAANNKWLNLAGTTTLNGNLALNNTYNAQIKVATLAGSGNIVIDDTRDEDIQLQINGKDAGYSGEIQVKNSDAQRVQVSVAQNMGMNVRYGTTSGEINTSGIASGNTIILNGASGSINNGTIAANVKLENTYNKAGMEVTSAADENSVEYAGTVSGSGNYLIGATKTVTVTNDDETTSEQTVDVETNTTFSGDTTGYTGQMRITRGEHNVTYTGSATSMNNSWVVDDGATVNVNLNHAAAATVSKAMSPAGTGVLNLSVTNSSDAGTKLAAGAKLNNLTVGDSTKLVLGGTTSAATATLGDGASLHFDGGSLDVTGSLTLNALSIDLSKYSTDQEIHTLVSAGTLSLGAGVNLSSLGGNVGNYTATVEQNDNSITLSFSEIVAPSGEITTTVTGIESFEGGVLTLIIDKPITSADLKANITGFGDGVLDRILSMTATDTDGIVGITLIDTDDLTDADIVGNGVDNVGFYGAYYGEGAEVGYQVAYIPEPASATLGLAALMMLCARRRRKA